MDVLPLLVLQWNILAAGRLFIHVVEIQHGLSFGSPHQTGGEAVGAIAHHAATTVATSGQARQFSPFVRPPPIEVVGEAQGVRGEVLSLGRKG